MELNDLGPVEKTLFIPLYGKAIEHKKKNPILIDKKAAEIIDNIPFNIDLIREKGIVNALFCVRAKIIDNFINDYFENNKENIVLHLGCGLDGRCYRIGRNNIDWYDVDFENVINIRKNYYLENEKYHLIPSSILEKGWLENIPKGKYNYIVIAEGVFQYLRENEIKELIQILKENIGGYTLIFDAFSKSSIKASKKDENVKTTGVTLRFGIDKGNELTEWDKNIKLVKERILSFEGINGGNIFLKIGLKIINIIPKLKGFAKILVYKIE